VLLPPQLCKIFPVTSTIYDMAMYLPSILWRLETLMLANDLQETQLSHMKNYPLKVTDILSCISAPGCQEEFCYERLEMLGKQRKNLIFMCFEGDTLLKVLYSIKLYRKYTDLQEGTLSGIRSRLISNMALYKQSLKIRLEDYILCNLFDAKKWVPMGAPNRKIVRSITCKTLADSMEALTGAFYKYNV
jgi:endoribonuclease Dicer